jgi:hypothetical protein
MERILALISWLNSQSKYGRTFGAIFPEFGMDDIGSNYLYVIRFNVMWDGKEGLVYSNDINKKYNPTQEEKDAFLLNCYIDIMDLVLGLKPLQFLLANVTIKEILESEILDLKLKGL